MNNFAIDGVVGSIKRKESVVFVRLCHKDAFYDKKKAQWIKKETWFSVAFFGKTADAVENNMEVADRMIAEGDLNVFPEEGPGSQIRLNGRSFYQLAPFAERRQDVDLTQPLEGAFDDPET